MSRVYDINPIPTKYKGITFRSRIEAIWAVFFDTLKWDWRYEDQYYSLPSGNYLPDFYFPDILSHGEVKPSDFTPTERLKCTELSLLLPDTQIIQLVGYPAFKPLTIIENGALLTQAVPVELSRKYYPFFYTDTFDANFFDVTVRAIFKSTEYTF